MRTGIWLALAVLAVVVCAATTSHAALWTPALTNTACWFDASDASTIQTNGSAVTNWLDKSGNSNHVSQGTSTKQPTLTTLDSSDAILFDASDDLLQAGGYSPSGDISVYMVAANNRATIPGTGGEIDVVLSTHSAGGGRPGMTFVTYHGYTTTSKRLFTYEGNGSSFSEYVDGSVYDDSELGYQTPHVFVGIGNATVGANPLTLGKYGDDRFQGNNYIQEVVIVDGQDSNDDRQKVEGYLAWKWGLYGNLPVGHPYKNKPPFNSPPGAVIIVR